MRPKVSICLLSYNHAHMLGGVFESILAQTHRDFELIACDDCSTDGSWELLQRLGANDRRVQVVRTPANLGMAGNANHAARLAAGDYIALLHHDDLAAPSLLEEWLAVAEEAPSAGFVFNDYDVGGTSSHAATGMKFERHMSGRAFLSRHLLRGWGCPVRGSALIHRARFFEIGGMREQYSLLADIDLWMRLAARWDVGYVARPLLRVEHAPPSDYPAGYTEFTWRRLRILFDIHAENLQALAKPDGVRARAAWWRFRGRVSLESAKWLAYAVIRRKAWMLAQAMDGRNSYEWWPVRLLRKALAAMHAGQRQGTPQSTSATQPTARDGRR